MQETLPTKIIAVTVWAYWIGVAIMLIRSRLVFKRAGGAKPAKKQEKTIWPIWLAVLGFWYVAPLWSFRRPSLMTSIPDFYSGTAIEIFRYAAAAIGVIAFLITIRLWIQMGRSWSIAVVPDEETELVTSGLYAWVRHPIYALSVCLVAMTFLVVPSPLMLIVASLHILFMNIKAKSEEEELVQVFGEQYIRMCQRTGRFVPKLWESVSPLADESVVASSTVGVTANENSSREQSRQAS